MVDLPAEGVDEDFVASVKGLIGRLAAREPAVKAPSWAECRYCGITSVDCPERVEGPPEAVATTYQF